MHTRIMATGLALSSTNRAFVHRQLGRVLLRYRDELQHVDVFLKDHNGPKGGKDLSATLRVRLANGLVVTVEEVREELSAAVTRVAQRMAFAIRRTLDERRRIDRRKVRGIRREEGLAKDELQQMGALVGAT